MTTIHGHRLTIMLLLNVATLSGCGPKPPENPAQPTTSVQEDFGTIDEVFASHDPRPEDLRLSLTEVEVEISKTGNWKPITLEKTGVGKYVSEAVTKDNREFQMEVRQTSKGIYWCWKNDDGSSGGNAMTTW